MRFAIRCRVSFFIVFLSPSGDGCSGRVLAAGIWLGRQRLEFRRGQGFEKTLDFR